MTLGNDNKAHDGPRPSTPARVKAEPVSVPENADFRYDEQEASDAGSQDEPRGTEP